MVVNPGAAANLNFVVQPTSAVSATAIAPAIQVEIRDALNNRVTTAANQVTLAIANNAGGGTLAGTVTNVSPASGVATFSNASIDKAGTGYTLSATATGLTPATSSAFNVTAGAAANITAASTPPASAPVGTSVTAPSVLVTDSHGNPVAGVGVTFTLTAGGGTITPASPAGLTTDAAGHATLTSWTLGTTAGTNTVTATSTGLSGSPVSFTVTGTAGTATHLAFTQQPTSATSGASIAPAITVTALDASNNVATGFANQISLAIGTNAGGGTLSGGAAVSPVNGVATFSAVSIDKAGTGYTLTTAATGVTGATSTTFNITAGTATHLVFTQPPTSAVSAKSITPAITVTALDARNNVATGFANQISLAIGTNAGGGTLSGGAAVSPVSGVATFSAVSIDKAGTGYTLTTAATGVTGATSATFNITAGAATTIAAASTPPASATVGTSVTAPSVLLTDTHGNPVSGVSVTFAVTVGNGSIAPTTPVATDGTGHATLTTWTLGTTAGINTVTAAATGLTGSPVTFSVTGTAGAVSAAQSTVSAPSPITASSGASQSTITVTAKDANGNPISGATVVLAASGTGNTLTQPVGTTNGAGVATGTFSSTVAESKTVSATINGVAITQTATVVVNPGAVSASQSTVTASSPITASAGSSQSTITVTAKDANGNVIPGATVVLGATGSNNTVTGSGGTTNSSGVLTGTLSSTTAESKTVSATINGVAITQTATAVVNAGAATQLVFTVQPTGTTALATITPPVVVAAEDAFGNIDQNFSGPVTLTLLGGVGPLTGTNPQTAVLGVATFSDLAVSTPGTYQLQATATGPSSGTSSSFIITL